MPVPLGAGGGLTDAGADGVDILDRGDEDLAVTEGPLAAGSSRLHDGVDHEVAVGGVDDGYQHGLGNLVIGHFADLDAALFAAPGHRVLGYRREAGIHQGGEDGVGLFRADNGSDHDHHCNVLLL